MKLHSLSISGLIDLNLHSLNNEGTEGNYMQTRQVQVIGASGMPETVNAISGDMFKHIQAEHLYNICLDKGLPLCGPCEVFDANRIVADKEFADSFEKDASDVDVLTGAIKRCCLDDTEGILITSEVGKKKRAIGRKSTLEFGWVVGQPENTVTDSFFHVKFDKKERGKGSGDESGANTGQNIFHRPASSGRYATVLNIDLYRVGQNDISLQYVLDSDERRVRSEALLKSVLYTFLKPNGAMRNTQSPHIANFSGIISLSNNSMPAPMVSPLNLDYKDEIKRIKNTLDQIEPGAITLKSFDSLAEFSEIMAKIIKGLEIVG